MSKLTEIVSETTRLIDEARKIKAMARLTIADLRRLATIRVRLTLLCPPERYAWHNGLPKVDILTELAKMGGEKNGCK